MLFEQALAKIRNRGVRVRLPNWPVTKENSRKVTRCLTIHKSKPVQADHEVRRIERAGNPPSFEEQLTNITPIENIPIAELMATDWEDC